MFIPSTRSEKDVGWGSALIGRARISFWIDPLNRTRRDCDDGNGKSATALGGARLHYLSDIVLHMHTAIGVFVIS